MKLTTDYYDIDDLLSTEHKLIRQSVRDFVDNEIKPVIDDAAQHHHDIPDLMKKLGSVGALGPYIPEEYGGAGLDQMSYGLIMQELERGDSAVRSAASVQSSLVMYPIYTYGSEEQKRQFLPKLASGDFIGSFGLTEPNHGSNPGGMETKLTKDGENYRLNGAKMWITNSPICDIAVVWAKDEEGKIRGIIVERDMQGFSTPETLNKWSLRASKTGEFVFDNVLIKEENILPHVNSLRGPLSCLNSARYGISWGVIGAAIDCYESALNYSLERNQFGKPIASYQLQQKKLAEFITEITKAQLLCWRLGTLKNENKATPEQISMAKRNNVKMALDIARESRQIIGAMGIVGEFPMMRHAANLESVITYEGTHDVHLLITGADITGINAFV
ncbi:glutaryl-CoA dehydrogenase [Chishuiella changwenlii]|uniref:Acyl-CoA dehydrogenase n=1 Tax=Chishuiella changwenlii TaxID=1434701 RepID=A0A1M7AQC9_9FLAO|nr:acyl-CoA dehydrogenase family protein [Chishuiella changwenlii]GGE90990.1 acyl-CoA dehydrogenase [Chishuiella changwenlii]SHL44921.1 glutaryl-CoA dehydrogenase [Chishuiella changwenlii]